MDGPASNLSQACLCRFNRTFDCRAVGSHRITACSHGGKSQEIHPDGEIKLAGQRWDGVFCFYDLFFSCRLYSDKLQVFMAVALYIIDPNLNE